MRLTAHLVTWNGAKYVPYLFESLRRQTYQDWELLIIDNNSSDNTVDLVQRELLNFPVSSRMIINKDNSGFAGGHNQAFRETSAPYALLLNQDLYLAPDCLEKLAAFMKARGDAAAAAPRLMRWDFSNNVFTDRIDALGLKVFRSRRVIEREAGKKWDDRGEAPALEVFGVSGAVMMFRRAALEQARFSDGTIFDANYFMYKEDLDLAYRLRSAGLKSYVLLSAIAYHDRTGAGARELSDWAAIKNKKTHSLTVRYYSYRNHLMTLYKNEYWQNFILDWPWIAWYELKKLLYFLLFDRAALAGFGEIRELNKDLKIKRKEIIKLRKTGWREIRKWWGEKK